MSSSLRETRLLLHLDPSDSHQPAFWSVYERMCVRTTYVGLMAVCEWRFSLLFTRHRPTKLYHARSNRAIKDPTTMQLELRECWMGAESGSHTASREACNHVIQQGS